MAETPRGCTGYATELSFWTITPAWGQQAGPVLQPSVLRATQDVVQRGPTYSSHGLDTLGFYSQRTSTQRFLTGWPRARHPTSLTVLQCDLPCLHNDAGGSYLLCLSGRKVRFKEFTRSARGPGRGEGAHTQACHRVHEQPPSVSATPGKPTDPQQAPVSRAAVHPTAMPQLSDANLPRRNSVCLGPRACNKHGRPALPQPDVETEAAQHEERPCQGHTHGE